MKLLRLSLWTILAFFALAQSASANVVFTYQQDFEGALPGWSGFGSLPAVEGYSAYGFDGRMLRNAAGDINNNNVQPVTRLTLTGLPAHLWVSFDFLLAIIDSWDGSTIVGGTAPPDHFNVRVGNGLVFHHTFDFQVIADQTYQGTPLVHGVHLFNGTQWADAAYDMGVEPLLQLIPHTSSTLVVDWYASGEGWQGGDDESWGIDNLTVSLVIPEPQSYALLIAGLGLLGFVAARRRTRSVSPN